MGDSLVAANVVVVLVAPRDDANVGAVARAMKNCGVRDLRLVRKRKPGARARRMAVHSEELLESARLFATLDAAVEGTSLVMGFTARARRFGPKLGVYTGAAAARVRRRARSGAVALVFGPEDSGLADAHVARCDELYKIPASAGRAVYNLAQAVLLALHPLAFASVKLAPERRAGAVRAASLDALQLEFARALTALRYPESASPHDRTARILARLRAQMKRACQDPDDVALWRGFLARIR